MPRPVCVKCSKEMRVAHNGVSVILMALSPPIPFEIWRGDEWQCPRCGASFVARYGQRSIAAHYEPKFEEALVAARAQRHYEVYER